MVRHFRAQVKLLENYHADPLPEGFTPRRTTIVWAGASVFDGVRPRRPIFEMQEGGPEGITFLAKSRTDWGPGEWKGLFPMDEPESDVGEKNQQAPLMGRTYRQAYAVQVWLGLTPDDGYDFYDAVDVVEELCYLASHYAEKLSLPLSDLGKDLSASPDSDRWRIARLDLAGHWRASWLYAGNDGPADWSDIICAVLFAETSKIFSTAVEGLRGSDIFAINRVVGLARTTALVRADIKREGIDLHLLLVTNKPTLATDPRDTVYSLLGMANNKPPDGSDLFITPDYGLDTAAVYQQVLRNLGLPSWVIDWSKPSAGILLRETEADRLVGAANSGGYDACLGDTFPKVYTVDGTTLKLSGFVVDEISECLGDLFRRNVFRGMLNTFRWSSHLKNSPIGRTRIGLSAGLALIDKLYATLLGTKNGDDGDGTRSRC
ncbi:hypothetical protein B0H63DRAFT_518258 [Podospora didyma]|uniref:Uncharacterized protein n=1 Tax=Podospora didyma TaxID=330526 RepID=A0AAE0P8V6_9PEZI|nr:hypothetical protein B0H63DRAFT_518258 [Podospora didyma]